jgi:ribosomal protein L11 methyltransferase
LNGEHWTSVRVRPTTNRPAVISALFSVGAESVQELDDGVVTHLKNVDRALVTDALREADDGAGVEFAPTPVVDWSREWRARIGAHRLGRLVVTPPWLADHYARDERIVIDPGMAFGTGEHETTRGVIRLMQGVVGDDDVVADLGAGSAVLAIAAARLGAARVIAIELDPDAIGNAEENIVRNGVADRVTVIEGDAHALLPLIAPVRLILANIVSSVILELLPTMRTSLSRDGRAILSGMLIDERAGMEGELRGAGWAVERSDEEGQWWSATIAPR